MGFNGRKYRGWHRGEVVAALDIGSTKVVCFIARLSEDGRPEIVASGPAGSSTWKRPRGRSPMR